MKLKKGDFIEIDYVGRIKENNKIFDLTKEDVAKDNKIYNEKVKYKPVIICLGYEDVVKGLDENLIGKDIGKHKFEVEPEKSFGKKKSELIKLVSTSIFAKQDIRPFPGLQVNIGGLLGIIKTAGGGRVLVDFNHPLAGKTLIYEIEIKKVIKDTKEKLNGFLSLRFKEPEFNLDKEKVTIKAHLNSNIKKDLTKEIKKRIPEIKKVGFKKQPLKNK